MRTLLSFPNPVDETAARVVAGGVAVLAVVTIAFQQGWLLPLLAYGFVARALTGPKLSPHALLATRVVTPRLPVRHRYAPGPAKRFAQAVGDLGMRLGIVPPWVCEACAPYLPRRAA
ncbi:MAG TPA: DUF4395 domain-containing protein [Gaiellaceae bacterium]|nr:DUF4395 domain-containing protein [Gaiellaceae bacterium]